MRFTPSFRAVTVPRALALVGAMIGLAALGRYHVGVAWTKSVFARPTLAESASGEVLLTGRAGGTPIVLPAAKAVLGAVTEVWDRPRSRKGAKKLCTDVAFGRLEIDGHLVDWHPAPARVVGPTTRTLFASGEPPVFVDLFTKSQGQPIPFGKCAVESSIPGRVIEVFSVRAGDTITVAGCNESGVVRPCGDGRDLLSARAPGPALRELQSGEWPFLIGATLLGVPAWLWLVVFLSRHTASLARLKGS